MNTQQQIEQLAAERKEWLIDCLVKMVEALMKEIEQLKEDYFNECWGNN